MDEVLEAPFYQDDVLTRAMAPSALYNKHPLELNLHSGPRPQFKESGHDDEHHTGGRQQHSCPNSPSLDFLQLGSPDLEKMFMNLQANTANSPSPDQNAAFTLANDSMQVSTENCFTDALQQLHDQQDQMPNNANIIHEQMLQDSHVIEMDKGNRNVEDVCINNSNNQHHHSNNNHMHNNNNNNISHSIINCNPTPLITRSPSTVIGMPMHNGSMNGRINAHIIPQAHIVPQEQMIFNNMAVINNNNHTIHPSMIHHHQHMQEINFLNHAMGLVPERDGMPHGMFDMTMVDPAVQLRHMQQRCSEPGFTDGNFHEYGQIHIPGVENVSQLNLEDQAKLYIENPHLQPINLEIQELVKRERKKLRNRVASSKCRKRKLEREARLEDRVKDLKEKNIELNAVANALKQQICDLKQRVMDHVNEGCQIVL